MAVAHSVLTSDIVTTNSTSYTTASVSFTAGRTYLLGIESTAGTAEEPSISGTGTWTKLQENISGTAAKNFVFYWVCGSSTSGTITLTTVSGHTGMGWEVIEFTGDDGNPGAPWNTAIASTGSATSLAATLSPSPASTSRVYLFAMINANEVQTTDATGGEDYDASVASPNRAHQGSWEDTSDGTITNSSTSSVSRHHIIVEIPIATAGTTVYQLGLLGVG